MDRLPHCSRLVVCWALAWGLAAGSARADEQQIVMRFAELPHTSRSVVRLEDLVEVLAGNSPSLEQLMAMPLGPAPRVGGVQGWHSEDVLQHLHLRGVHPASIRWSGPTFAELQRLEDVSSAQQASLTPAFVSERIVDQAAGNVSQAILEYLNLRNAERIDWRVQVDLPAQHATLLQVRRNIASIGGGEEPWIGEQEFVLQVKNRGTLMSLPIRATVALPPMVVASLRAIRREDIISADDLTYVPLPRSAKSEASYYTDMEQLVGKQARRSISTGLPITEDFIGDPIVVSRNDLVEIESVAGAITIRTSGKALGSGAVGDLVEVELPSRHRLHATVVGHAVVRVAAVAARVTSKK